VLDMHKNPLRTRRSRVLGAAMLSAVMAVSLAVFVASGSASASRPSPAVKAPPTVPTSAFQIQNLDQVKSAIKAYYGDTVSTTPDPVTGTTFLHFASPTGNYAAEMAGIEHNAEVYLAAHRKPTSTKQALIFDIDDTTLNTFSYEIYSSFVFSSTTNGAFVSAGVFPAVFGMPQVVNDAQAEGYTIFFLTGRSITQSAPTIANLTNVGYPSLPSTQYYLKDTTAPWLVPCGGSACTTDQYKSLTRQHIESLGYHIVANFGDQFSDLSGGFDGRQFKLPNPMYFLP
jgi:hypothetical protein